LWWWSGGELSSRLPESPQAAEQRAVAARICATAAPVGAAKMLRDIVPARARGPCLRMSALMVRRTEFVHGVLSQLFVGWQRLRQQATTGNPEYTEEVSHSAKPHAVRRTA
jgi:hypothetical protein